MREYFFGKEASTAWNKKRLQKMLGEQYRHYQVDIRDEVKIRRIFKNQKSFDLILHTAAQPSHDWAVKEPSTDFTVNAMGTLNMLENCRLYSPESVFIFTSTNKVYGERPNKLPLIEKKTRFELPRKHKYYQGIDESMSIDNTKRTIFGVSKTAADLMVQEYGKYFGLKTGVFRGGCLTGPAHSGTKLHGFLAYLVKCIAEGIPYTIMGYKGKQVRDNIHSYDLVNMFWHFYQNPRLGQVYNVGGGRHSNVSILEAIEKIERLIGKKGMFKYDKDNKIGDHIWYVSNIAKFRRDFPQWQYKYDIDMILKEICNSGHFKV